jgi:hypothetical protein
MGLLEGRLRLWKVGRRWVLVGFSTLDRDVGFVHTPLDVKTSPHHIEFNCTDH